MEPVESYYDEKSVSYRAARQNPVFRIYDAITWKFLEPLVPTDLNSLVLDAGGGTGVWAIPMARKGCKVVLLDVSERMLEEAKKEVEVAGLQDRVEIRKGDMRNLDCPDETFDLVLSEHTLFLFQEPDQVVAELVRVLKKNAPIVLSAQNRLVQVLAHLPNNPTENPGILQTANRILHKKEHDLLSKERAIKIFSLTPQEFRDILERNGLKIERIFPKIVTLPLRFEPRFLMGADIPKEIERHIMQLELAFSELPDTEALGAHLQAIARKI
ncbi:MAG: methyltransferase domain-containing protein [Candidatus Bathyarchaeia archaeon]